MKALSAEASARVDFALYGTIRPEDGAQHIPEMVGAGAAAFKFSTFETHPTRFPRIGWDRPKASDHCPVVCDIIVP